MPATSRREERLIEAAARVAGLAARGGAPISIAASRAADLEGLTDMITASGRPILRRALGRPALDETAEVLVWDVSVLTPAELTWVGLLSANRPTLAIILLDSFPRGDLAIAAARAGAAAVLARPVSLEAITGTLLAIEACRTTPSPACD
jgi:ActR/RegA family two-component response regulator